MNTFTKVFPLSQARCVRAYLTHASEKREVLRRVCLSFICLFTVAVCPAICAVVDGIYYNLDTENMTAEVTKGANNYSGNIIIPESITAYDKKYSVTSIGKDAFENDIDLISVIIPNSVTTIGSFAFRGCSGLTSVTIPNSVTTIESYAFYGCSGLTSFSIPDGVTSIRDGVFGDCSGLTSITIPNSITEIWYRAFEGCNGLTSVTIPNSVTTIGHSAFKGCSGLTSFSIPDGVTTINYSAFNGCSGLTSVTIPNSVTNIEEHAFENCSGLTSVTIPNNVTTIESYAFSGCSGLTSFSIPDGVTTIESYAFSGCSRLTSFSIPDGVTTIENGVFKDCSGLTSVTIPNSVTAIREGAFSNCSVLTAVSIPNSITSIEASTFSGCSELASVTIPNNVSIINASAFSGCIGLKNIIIDDGAEILNLSNETFKDCPLEVLYLGRNISKVSETGSPFCNIQTLTTITIGNNVTSINNSAFAGCNGIKELIIEDGAQTLELGNLDLYKGVFYDCPIKTLYIGRNLSYMTLPIHTATNSMATIGSNVSNIDVRMFSGLMSVKVAPNNVIYDSRNDCNAIIQTATNTLIVGSENTAIPNSVTSIGGGAFSECSGLTSITIPNSVTSIGGGAFSGCSGLTSITIPNSVTSIGGGAFNYCSGLKEVIIMDSDQMLELSSGFESLETLYLGRNILYSNYSPFHGLKTLNTVTIGNNVTSINGYMFSECSGLTNLTIPNSVTYIGSGAFYGCGNLESITLGDYIKSFDQYNTFYGCPAKLYVNNGTGTLLTAWSNGIEPYEIGTGQRLTEPYITVSTTQTTAKVMLRNYKQYTDFVFYKDYYYNEILEDNEYTITGLNPETTHDASITISKDVNGETFSCTIYKDYKTQNIDPTINSGTATASSINYSGSYIHGDAKVVSQAMAFGDGTYSECNTGHNIGLEPNKSYTVYYKITLENGTTYTTQKNVSTQSLTLETQQPKVINAGDVIVKATSNIDDAEKNVGFEWRRTDWTNDFASNTGSGYLYGGEMEGYIRNMAIAYLWKYRPYYESNSGSRYYGEWVGIDPTNTSYFEPTVHTYDKVNVDGNMVKVTGYAQRGTDNITEQGFVYWKNNTANNAKGYGARDISSVPAGAQTVTVRVSNNPVIEATLSGLDFNSNYSYVAFITTDEGIFYGEEQIFTTGVDTTGISRVESENKEKTIIGYYSINGQKMDTIRPGINIIRYSDGSTRKVLVK